MKSFKWLLTLLVLALFSSMAFAWELPAKNIHLGGDKLSLGASAGLSEDCFLLMPITDVSFNLGQANNYGLGGAYGFVFANVSPADATHVNVMPYFFIGPFISANVSEFVNSNGKDAPGATIGLVLGLPKLDKDIPEIAVQFGWDLRGGPSTISIDAAFPLMIAPDSTIHKL